MSEKALEDLREITTGSSGEAGTADVHSSEMLGMRHAAPGESMHWSDAPAAESPRKASTSETSLFGGIPSAAKELWRDYLSEETIQMPLHERAIPSAAKELWRDYLSDEAVQTPPNDRTDRSKASPDVEAYLDEPSDDAPEDPPKTQLAQEVDASLPYEDEYEDYFDSSDDLAFDAAYDADLERHLDEATREEWMKEWAIPAAPMEDTPGLEDDAPGLEALLEDPVEDAAQASRISEWANAPMEEKPSVDVPKTTYFAKRFDLPAEELTTGANEWKAFLKEHEADTPKQTRFAEKVYAPVDLPVAADEQSEAPGAKPSTQSGFKWLSQVEQRIERGALARAAAKADLTHITAGGSMNGNPGPHEIRLPSSWVEKFEPGSAIMHLGRRGARLGVGTARLASDPRRTVMFRAYERGAPETERELEVAERMALTGVVPVLLDLAVSEEVAYLLEEPYVHSLARTLALQIHPDQAPPGAFWQMSPGKSAPIMAALLRSLIKLQEAGIAHGDLMEENIFPADQHDHALITDFHAASVFDEERGGWGFGDFAGSAWRQPPETERDVSAPTPEGDVWRLGLVFARMVFNGRLVTMECAMKQSPWKRFEDDTKEGRELIRDSVRHTLNLSALPGYKRLQRDHPRFMHLIEGMLEKDPEKRLTAVEALEMLEDAAFMENAYLPEPQDPLNRGEDLVEAWKQGVKDERT